ncbi:hypothetical protein QYS48_26285 [Marivirga arenosa]|uniref:Uncharacterized protein n=1 Tax=Marivirga arenosa TaxID=3059076 RepID=A0AA49GFS7_9BACT|nr:hypothetical protein [Marivirga sp. ABR2-2]WKK85390.2 hypothetical protein QYS48_26285 [Marivirga sp. ABR2-2]
MKKKVSGELNSVSSRNSTNYTENADWLNVLRDPKEAQINYTLPLPVEKEGDNLIISNLIIVQSRNTDNLNYAVVKITYKDDATIYTIHDLEEKYNYTSQSNAQNETGRIIGDCYEIMFEIPWSIEVGGTVVHGSDIHTELICNDGGGTSGSTGESGGGETFPIPTGGGSEGIDDNDGSISIVGNPTVEDAVEAHNLEKKIDDSQLEPCMQSIMTDLKNLNKGVGEIIQKFAGDLNGYNWEVKDGDLPENQNAFTSQQYNSVTGTVTSTFDTDKFQNASDLSIARTILHEAVHAIILADSRNIPTEVGTKYPDLIRDYALQKFGGDANSIQHAEFVRNFVNEIAVALNQYGTLKGYSSEENFSPQYYKDLAWGGLTHWTKLDENGDPLTDDQGNVIFEETTWFQSEYRFSSSRNRVLNIIKDEQEGNANQKGNNAGC